MLPILYINAISGLKGEKERGQLGIKTIIALSLPNLPATI